MFKRYEYKTIINENKAKFKISKPKAKLFDVFRAWNLTTKWKIPVYILNQLPHNQSKTLRTFNLINISPFPTGTLEIFTPGVHLKRSKRVVVCYTKHKMVYIFQYLDPNIGKSQVKQSFRSYNYVITQCIHINGLSPFVTRHRRSI